MTETAATVRRRSFENPWVIAFSTVLAMFMEVLDTTVVNVSLGHIAGSLAATVDESTWVLTSYLVSNAVVLPMSAWLANYFGRRRLLLISIAGFTISSVACGMATSLPALILFRILQGAAGGGLAPLSQAIVLEAFPPEKQSQGIAVWGLGVLLAPVIGPLAGGWITEHYSWRWIFYINLPVGLIALALCYLFVFDPPYIKRTVTRIDYWGMIFLTVGIGALQVFLDKGQEEDWMASTLIRRLAVAAAIGLAALVIRELTTAEPIVDLRAFRFRNFAAGTTQAFIIFAVMHGSTVLLPIFCQSILGYSSYMAGLATVPQGMGTMAGIVLAGLVAPYVDQRWLIVCGLVLAGAATWSYGAINLAIGPQDLRLAQFLQGAGCSFVFIPLTAVAYDKIPKKDVGNASSIFNLVRNIGGSVGISFVTTMIARRTQANTNVLGGHVTPLQPASQRLIAAATSLFAARGFDPFSAARKAYAALFGMIEQQAWMLSFNSVVHLLGALFFVILPLAFLMRRPAKSGSTVLH
jgi:DHA2 family multidrug resistance protein